MILIEGSNKCRIIAATIIAALLFQLPNITDSAECEYIEPEIVIVSRETERPITERDRLEQMSSRGEIRSVNMEITAYSMGTITATGTTVREGVVAVDPDIIPYGSLLYIVNVGYVTAEDCGGAINGYMLDLYMNSQRDAINWGRQYRKVYIVRMGYDV